MIYIAIFLIFSLISAATLVVLLLMLLGRLFGSIRGKSHPKQLARIKRVVAVLIVSVILNSALIAVSQFTASTPRIMDENGNLLENSIAELKQLKLNGKKQWISIRGRNKNNPVLLFLAGGPGGTQMAAVRHELAELEKHFVVVNWDQPGSGKSYFATRKSKITVDTYVEDGYELTKYLKERFSQEKIYLIGESWGSALGIFLISKHPQSYHAFIGTGQMVDFEETERIDYAKAMELAEQNGDTALIKKLKANGEPPYYGKGVTWKSSLYLNYLNEYMAGIPEVKNPGYNTFRDIGSSEYGLMDKITFFAGIINTFNHVYPKLYDIDLRKDYAKLQTPVYFFLGRYDYNAPTALVEEYQSILEVPDKGIVWFEHSAHNPWINERDKFVEEVILRFLGQ